MPFLITAFFFDPLGHTVKDMIERPLTNRTGIYSILNKAVTEYEKIGATRQLRHRPSVYARDDETFDESLFQVIVDFDNINESLDSLLQEIYQLAMEELGNADALHPVQQQLVRFLWNHEGDRLCPKAQIIIQLVESGFQLRLNAASPQEFTMFDENVCDKMYELCSHLATDIVKELSTLERATLEGKDARIFAVSSWKSGHKGLSSTQVATECFLGEDNKGAWRDTMPTPAVENATTGEQKYSTNYTSKEKADGRQRLYNFIEIFLHRDCGILFVDTNKLILDDDPDYHPKGSDDKSVIGVLTNKYSFKVVAKYLGSEITLLLDQTKLHAVLVHKPVCIASDSRPVIKMVTRVRRSLSIGVLTNASRLLRGEPVLKATDQFRNPINAIIMFQIMRQGLHQGWKPCALASRVCMSSPEREALNGHGLKISASTDRPVAKNLLAWTFPSNVAVATNVRRPVDKMLLTRARCLVSRAKPGLENKKELYRLLIILFRENWGFNDPGLVSSRFRLFLRGNIKAGSELHTTLMMLRRFFANNPGNQKATGCTDARIISNNNRVRFLVDNHGPTNGRRRNGTPFWIKESLLSQKPPGDYDSVDTHPIFEALCFEGLEERTKPRPRKNNTVDQLADKYFHLKLEKLPHRRLYVQELPQIGYGYCLVKLVRRY